MKKLVCLLTVLLFAGVSFAQTSTASVTQYGSNVGEILQTGTYDNAVITQGASGSPVSSISYQGWALGAFIDQTGDNNDATINVTKSDVGADIDQVGDFNKAYMDINTTSTKTNNFVSMGADIYQEGNSNYAAQTTLTSFGTAGIKGILINQEGSDNRATQLSVGGYGSTMKIYQEGSFNGENADVSATTLANPLGLVWAHKPLTDGFGNTKFTQYQNGNGSVATINVDGDYNQTVQYQEYTLWSHSGQNSATLDITGSRNNVAQAQLGESNTSDIDMNGDLNVVGTSQLGNINSITVGITGNLNVVGVEQVGNGFSKDCTVTQDGSTNFAQVVQH